jgi:hypothetical protein
MGSSSADAGDAKDALLQTFLCYAVHAQRRLPSYVGTGGSSTDAADALQPGFLDCAVYSRHRARMVQHARGSRMPTCGVGGYIKGPLVQQQGRQQRRRSTRAAARLVDLRTVCTAEGAHGAARARQPHAYMRGGGATPQAPYCCSRASSSSDAATAAASPVVCSLRTVQDMHHAAHGSCMPTCCDGDRPAEET